MTKSSLPKNSAGSPSPQTHGQKPVPYAGPIQEFHRCRGCGRQFSVLPDTDRAWCNYCSTMNSKPFAAA